MYSFSFEVFSAPDANLGSASVEFFAPGSGTDLPADVIVPGPNCCSGGSITQYCSANANSVNPVGAILTYTGTPNVTSNDLHFDITSLPTNQFGYFLMSASQGFVANFGGSDGNLCLGAPQYPLQHQRAELRHLRLRGLRRGQQQPPAGCSVPARLLLELPDVVPRRLEQQHDRRRVGHVLPVVLG